MSVTKRVDSNLFQFLMAHVNKHIPGDLGNKTRGQSETKANACDTNKLYAALSEGFHVWAELARLSRLARFTEATDHYEASQPKAVMITKSLEAVHINCVLPAVPLLVWFGGISRRE